MNGTIAIVMHPMAVMRLRPYRSERWPAHGIVASEISDCAMTNAWILVRDIPTTCVA
jgi:hypothetical protein